MITANLTLASLLVGTPWALPLDGALLVLEEIGERPYEIDRYLTQLILTGELARARAVIVGDLTRCVDVSPPTGEPDPADAALQTVLERLRTAGTPAAVGAPLGHGDRNAAVPVRCARRARSRSRDARDRRSRRSVKHGLVVRARLDRAEPLLVALDVLLQGLEQALGVAW